VYQCDVWAAGRKLLPFAEPFVHFLQHTFNDRNREHN
jgi:hypothetical protein